MGHHHAISADIQYKVNYDMYTLQHCGYIILLLVGGANVVVGKSDLDEKGVCGYKDRNKYPKIKPLDELVSFQNKNLKIVEV